MIKKSLVLFLAVNIMFSPSYALITDEFVEKSLSVESVIKPVSEPKIVDEFVPQVLGNKESVHTKKFVPIEDTFAEMNTNKNAALFSQSKIVEKLPAVDKKTIGISKPVVFTGENATPIKIRIKRNFSTKQEIDEGDYIEFETISEVKIKDKVYPPKTTVKARVETISPNKPWGVPADLTVGNFSIENHSLKGEINKTGANRSLWLYPTAYATTVFFGVGFLLIPIHGGHAKINNQQVFTIHYAE